jgi:hypothetical protein
LFLRSFTVIQKNNEVVLKAIVNDPTVDPKLQNFFSSCMNLTAIENNGIEPVYGLFGLIDGIDGVRDFSVAIWIGFSAYFLRLESETTAVYSSTSNLHTV